MGQLISRRAIELSVDLLVINGLLMGLPTILYLFLLHWGWTLLPLQLGVSGLYLLAAVMVTLETLAVLWAISPRGQVGDRGLLQRFFSRHRHRVWRGAPHGIASASPQASSDAWMSLLPETAWQGWRPSVSMVVVAYLPNEQGIIRETLEHILTQVRWPAAKLEVLLAYNTPVALPVEEDLRAMAARYPALKLLKVIGSTSKAQNLNAALEEVTGEITCVFDADHHPSPDCLERACRWLWRGRYDLIQGRNVIRNHQVNWLTSLVGVEFECLYGVSHFGRSLLVDTALFGGSNGYWRTSVLKEICFRSSMLTEDIDATLRALIQGYRIVHDPYIITTELAPEDIPGLWSQRCRWSQGWLEVALAHQQRVARSRHLDLLQKAYWLIMLLYSEGFHPLALQVIPITVSLSLADFTPPMAVFWAMLASTLFTLFSGIYQVFAAMRFRNPVMPYPTSHYVLYCLLTPLYFWFKSLVAVVALVYHLRGRREWHVTRRANHKAQEPRLDVVLR